MTHDPHATTLAAGGADESTAASSGAASLSVDERRVVLGDRYEIHGLLGAGGMGNVYKARDLELEEFVALKVLRPELVGTPGALDRFRREVKLARRVTHPNVARVYDIGDRAGDKILTMELVEGESLAALLERSSPLPMARAIEIALAVANGVSAAHAAGVVHRDLKPDNVLLASNGRVVVTDFGIARAAAANAAERTIGIVGTPLYMAPEQVEGLEVDERADVYAFGVMLYEIVTGEHAWSGGSPIAVAAARVLRPPPDPRAARPDLDPGLAAIILRCMARAPGDRYASMTDLAADLLALEPVASAEPKPESAPFFRVHGATDKRVAVLPFRNLGDKDHDYVAEALTEDLIDLLSVARGVHVQSRGVVMRYAGENRDPREIGRELGVQIVVEGAVRRRPGAFRIQARVISVADGFQLWAQRFEGTDGDPLRLNDEVARAVAQAISVDFANPTRATSDAESVDLYLKARTLHHRFYSGDAGSAIAMFQGALERTPGDPRIIAGWVMARSRSPRSTDAELPELVREAERAIQLAPSLPDAHVALGMVLVHSRREVDAMGPLKRALRLMPTSAEAHDVMGRVLCETGRPEGRTHLETAIALEPGFEFARASLAREHALHGDWDASMALMTGHRALPLQARMALWRRDIDLARSLLESATTGFDRSGPIQRVMHVMLLAAAEGTPLPDDFGGDPGLKPRVRAFLTQVVAEVSASLGDRRRALEAIEEGVALGLFDLAWLDGCPPLEPLRGEAAFSASRATVAERAERIVAAYVASDA